MRRCVICGANLDGKRKDAEVCGSTCRAEKSRRRLAGEPIRQPRRRTRPRSQRPGLEVYIPAGEIKVLIKLRDSATPELRRLAERVDRLASRRAAR
jgi:hypothetical protein